MDATSPTDTGLHHDPSDAGALPALDVLLRLSAEGDRAAFAALYDVTVPWVHALSRSVLASERDAAEATALVYLTAWDEAPDADLDLTDDDDFRRRERTVFTWLEVLAHRVVTTLARTDSLPERGHGLLPDNAGKGDRPPAEPPLSCASLTDEQYRAVALAWLGGRTARRLAQELDVPVARAKELVRDGVQALVAAHRDAEQERGTLTGPISAIPSRAAGLTDTVRGDVDAGRVLELADLAALDALDGDERTLVEGSVAGRGPSEGTLWRTRLRAARNAVTWAFRSHQEEPPSDLLDRVLRRLPAQDIGVALVDHEEVQHTPEEEAPRRRRMLVTVGVAVALVLIALISAIVLLTGPSLPERVDRAADVYHSDPVQTRDGGTMQVATSRDIDAGYVRLEGLEPLPQGQAYQLWLLPKDESQQAQSLGVFDADELAEPVTFHGIDAHGAVGMTVEPEAGAEQPSDDVQSSVVLRPGNDGPRYGGQWTMDG
ncbi:anti-sigma factor domain-containing protein [Micrococcus luteus]